MEHSCVDLLFGLVLLACSKKCVNVYIYIYIVLHSNFSYLHVVIRINIVKFYEKCVNAYIYALTHFLEHANNTNPNIKSTYIYTCSIIVCIYMRIYIINEYLNEYIYIHAVCMHV